MKWPSLSAGVEMRGVRAGERPSMDEAGEGEMGPNESSPSKSSWKLEGKGGGVGAGVPEGDRPKVRASHSLVMA